VSSSIHADLEPFVSRLASHSSLSDEDQQAILELPTHAVQVSAHRDFVRLGETVDYACFILDGMAGRFGQNEAGERQFTAFHIPGDIADLHSVVLPNASSGLHALTTTTILRVPHAALRKLIKARPTIAEAFWRECMIDAAILAQWVVNVGRRDAQTRMAHLLCEMAVRFGSAGAAESSYTLPITQAQLADATALTPVHVNRTLKALREGGLAAVRFKEVQIVDWVQLQIVGEFDPTYLGTAARAARPQASSIASGRLGLRYSES
jgi:CRP-like cAMP-binding protein